jgi:hypothetical protein
MLRFQLRKTVSATGARMGSILGGASPQNRGLRLRILHDQPKGTDGPISGGFAIVQVGDNLHSGALAALVDKVTDAAEVVRTIRRKHPGCVNVVNANILVVEGGSALSPILPATGIKLRDAL